MRVMDIFPFAFLFHKGVKPPVKPGRGTKESDPPGKYIKKPIVGEVLTGFRVPRQRGYKSDKGLGQLQPPKNTAAA